MCLEYSPMQIYNFCLKQQTNRHILNHFYSLTANIQPTSANTWQRFGEFKKIKSAPLFPLYRYPNSVGAGFYASPSSRKPFFHQQTPYFRQHNLSPLDLWVTVFTFFYYKKLQPTGLLVYSSTKKFNFPA